jgi:hypothetical protein
MLKEVSVYEVQDGVEQDGNGPIIRCKRQATELGRKSLVLPSLLQVLLKGHSQETAAAT